MERDFSNFFEHMTRSLDTYAGILTCASDEIKCSDQESQHKLDRVLKLSGHLTSLREYVDLHQEKFQQFFKSIPGKEYNVKESGKNRDELRTQIREELEKELRRQLEKELAGKKNSGKTDGQGKDMPKLANVSVKKEVEESQKRHKTGMENDGHQQLKRRIKTEPQSPQPDSRNERSSGDQERTETIPPKRPNILKAETSNRSDPRSKNEKIDTNQRKEKVCTNAPLEQRRRVKKEFYWQSSPQQDSNNGKKSGNRESEETKTTSSKRSTTLREETLNTSKKQNDESNTNQRKEKVCTNAPLEQRRRVKKEFYWQSSPQQNNNNNGKKTDQDLPLPRPVSSNKFDKRKAEQEAIDNFDYSNINARYMSDDDIPDEFEAPDSGLNDERQSVLENLWVRL